ncbi:MAG: NUDIX domain-containing protein [Thermotogae bacterium]|nr:NUDIX domain-containing protein [Thermotogota bacterium]
MDIRTSIENKNLEIRVSAVIIRNNKILLKRSGKKSYMFLPGVNIKIGEFSEESIKREIYEEFGEKTLKVTLAAFTESSKLFGKNNSHEICFHYRVEFSEDSYLYIYDEIKVKKGYKENIFKWTDVSELEKFSIVPEYSKEIIRYSGKGILHINSIPGNLKNILSRRYELTIAFNSTYFNCRAVGIILKNNKVLVHREINEKNFWTLPGGRVEFLESSEDALKREMAEELSEQVIGSELIFIEENFFERRNNKFYQLGIYYKTEFDKESSIYNLDSFTIKDDTQREIFFKWIDIEDLENEPLFPEFLRRELKNITYEPKHIKN